MLLDDSRHLYSPSLLVYIITMIKLPAFPLISVGIFYGRAVQTGTPFTVAGVSVNRPTSSSWSRKNSVPKTKTQSDVDDNRSGNVTKLKKKKFSIFSLARKSLSPKKGVRPVAADTSLTSR